MTKGKVTINDVRAVGFCVRGVKTHYESLGLDLSFRDFLKHGMDIEDAEKIEDAQVQRAVDHAKKRTAQEMTDG